MNENEAAYYRIHWNMNMLCCTSQVTCCRLLHVLHVVTPDASVVPTPFRPQRVVMDASMFGSFLNAFLDSVWTALGVLILTKLVNWG